MPNRVFRTLQALAITITAAGLARPIAAQTHDDARLTLGIAFGRIGGADVWHVANQPIQSSDNGAHDPDIFDLTRRVRSDISLSGQFTYFSTKHFGFTGEFTFIGLGPEDGCSLVQDGGDAELKAACAALVDDQGSAAGTAVNVGFIVRPFAHTAVQPYLKAMGGFAFTPTSTIRTESLYGAIGDTLLALTIYTDDDWKPIRPTWTLAAGIATAPSSGYQLRIEARETWLGLGEVTGPNPTGQGFIPPHRTAIKMLPSILVGFDIVLERKHGRRY